MATKSKSRKPTTRREKAPALPPVPVGETMSIGLDKLVLSLQNVRNIYDPEGIAALADSIARRGLLQSLSVRPVIIDEAQTGVYEVIAGGRRFRALEKLLGDKRIPADFAVTCIMKSEGDAIDDSLAENSDREALHPLDEFRAFKSMRDNGRSEEDIAAAYRVTAAVVRQRLRLANCSPRILQAYQDDDIELETVMAYCIVDDHARQEKVFDLVSESGNDYPMQIKRMLTETTVPSGDRRVRFVGLDAYEAAGGHVLRDLFSERDEGYLQDPVLLDQLVQKKLDEARDGFLAAGWAWADVAFDQQHGKRQGLTRIDPIDVDLTAEQQARLDEISAQVDALSERDELTDEEQITYDALEAEMETLENPEPVFAKDDMARAGVFAGVDWNGQLDVNAGYVRSADIAPAEAGGTTQTDPASPAAAADASGTSKKIPDRLVQDLTAFRTAALRDALGHDFATAFLAVLHAMCLRHYYNYGTRSSLQIANTSAYPTMGTNGLDSFKPVSDFDKRNAALKKLLPTQSEALWDALQAMDDGTRQQIFAHVAGAAVNAVREYPHNRRDSEIRHSHQLQSALGLHMVSTGWAPTAESYFGRVTKDHILAAVTEARDADTADLIATLKKDAMAKEAERLVQGTGWLPAALRNIDVSQGTLDDAESDLEVDDSDGELPAFLAADDAADEPTEEDAA